MIDDGRRVGDLSLGELARRLGIRPQSLYAHVDGAEGLGRAIAASALHALARDVTAASIGASGHDAAAAIVRAHLAFARDRPGLYEAALHPPGDDVELQAAVDAAGAPLTRVLDTLGLSGEAQVHWTRVLLASVYGFAVLHHTGRFSLPVDTLTSQEHLVAMLLGQLTAESV